MILCYNITEQNIFEISHNGDSSDLDALLREMILR